jgi:hypothetical protein
VLVIDDLAGDERWPRFSHRAAEETGVHSMLSFRLFVEGDTFGALNLYSREVAAFNDHAGAVGTVLAAHGAIAMQSARESGRAEQLQHALASNREIGMAMDVVMARSGCRSRRVCGSDAGIPVPQSQAAGRGSGGRRDGASTRATGATDVELMQRRSR